MTESLRPPFSKGDAAELARTLFGIEANSTELVSHKDRNYRLEQRGTGERSVLKIQRLEPDLALLEAENQVLDYLERQEPTLPCPRVLPSSAGKKIEVVSAGGEEFGARRVSWLPGRHPDRVSHTSELLSDIGHSLARLDGCLERAQRELELHALERTFDWELTAAPDMVLERVSAIEDPDRRGRVIELIERHQRLFAAPLARCRKSLIHNDFNELNLLVADPRTGPERFEPKELTGILDFGDLVVAPSICELAIAVTYFALYQHRPLTGVGPLVSAYHQIRPLDEHELALLLPLVLIRLCLSVTIAAHRRALEPDNEYLSVSEAPAWNLLEALAGVHPHRAEWLFRHVCGLEPCPGSRRVAAAIGALNKNAQTRPAPVLGFELTDTNTHVLDSSLASPLFPTVQGLAPSEGDEVPGASTAALSQAVRDHGKRVGWGRYDEARPFYGGEQFARPGEPVRTVHLGVDLACDPGTQVFAPLEGTVHSFADNAHAGDYGPTVILEHSVPAALEGTAERTVEETGEETVRFLTLYGHLARESIAPLRAGQSIAKGEALAKIGRPEENGGWWPHLHFQLIVDSQSGRSGNTGPLDLAGDFPGVAAPEERAAWLSVSPDPNCLLGLEHPTLDEQPTDSRDELDSLRDRRERSLARNLSLSYRDPLHIVRGEGAWLYDSLGRRYLDLVNNVCHIGHCHPAVVRAVSEQMAVLNTNTRYFHRNLLDYAERLAATLPDPLGVCFFVNSGSEANDLALRIARAATGRSAFLCLEGAYHGNLASLIDVSPYKHDGPGGQGTPGHVIKAPLPDPYRGRHRGSEAAEGYAVEIEELVRQNVEVGKAPAAFIVESVLGCGGQVVLPQGYLARAFQAVRGAGGLCIADEVQVGFGRVGSHFWGFETQNVVPDLVTLGKPIGNGHPLGAVVTTRKIADAFATGMEYFNTFGGSPVSCAAGLAVLDTLEQESLQQHAHEVGTHLLGRLRELGGERHPFVGDVRGLGLFLGIEMIEAGPSDPADDLRPDADLAKFVVEQMKEHGFLLSTDGPDHNVIKIKPPITISQQQLDSLADHLAETRLWEFVTARSLRGRKRVRSLPE